MVAFGMTRLPELVLAFRFCAGRWHIGSYAFIGVARATASGMKKELARKGDCTYGDRHLGHTNPRSPRRRPGVPGRN